MEKKKLSPSLYYSDFKTNCYLIRLYSDGEKLTELKFNNLSKNFSLSSPDFSEECIFSPDKEIFRKTENWLTLYFAGKNPSVKNLPLAPSGTDFQKIVWNELLKIPYGTSVTYGELSRRVAVRMNKEAMSAQAIGTAVGKNPVPVIIPCHRVLAAGNKTGGYALGLETKRFLLNLEHIPFTEK